MIENSTMRIVLLIGAILVFAGVVTFLVGDNGLPSLYDVLDVFFKDRVKKY